MGAAGVGRTSEVKKSQSLDKEGGKILTNFPPFFNKPAYSRSSSVSSFITLWAKVMANQEP